MEGDILRELAGAVSRLNRVEILQYALIIGALLFASGAFYVIRHAFKIAGQAQTTVDKHAKIIYLLSLSQDAINNRLSVIESDVNDIQHQQIRQNVRGSQ